MGQDVLIAPVGNEILYVIGVTPNGQLAAETEQTTTGAIAGIAYNFFPIRTVTLSGDVQIEPTDYTVILNKIVDQATTVFAPEVPFTGERFQVKDGNGHSVSFPITIDGNGFEIDGVPTLILNTGYEAVELVFNGVEYNIVSAYSASAIPPGTNYITDELGNKLTDELGNRIVTG